jgi:hypothetical protein
MTEQEWIGFLILKITEEIFGSKQQKNCCGLTTQRKDWEKRMRSNWHSISIKRESFKELKELQELIPIAVSVPQTIEWLIKVGRQQIKQSENNDSTEL